VKRERLILMNGVSLAFYRVSLCGSQQGAKHTVYARVERRVNGA